MIELDVCDGAMRRLLNVFVYVKTTNINIGFDFFWGACEGLATIAAHRFILTTEYIYKYICKRKFMVNLIKETYSNTYYNMYSLSAIRHAS